MKKNVTAKDIAKLCGVSQATVSYVINNRQNQKISEETRRKVLDAVEALHYYPNGLPPKAWQDQKLYIHRNCMCKGLQPPGFLKCFYRNQPVPVPD